MRLPKHTVRRAVVLGTLAALVITPVAAGTASATPTCPVVYWGSLAKVDSATPDTFQGILDNIRAGRHDCYDRLVLDIRDADAVEYEVQYVSTIIGDGSGEPVPVNGGAVIQILLRGNTVLDGDRVTYLPGREPNVTGFDTFRQVKFVSNFEGHTVIGLGVRGRLPMRVFELAGPGNSKRLVIDVRHAWTAF